MVRCVRRAVASTTRFSDRSAPSFYPLKKKKSLTLSSRGFERVGTDDGASGTTQHDKW